MNGSKKFYESKVFWFNALALVAAVAAGFGYTGEVPANLAPFVLPVILLINIALRFVTKQGISL